MAGYSVLSLALCLLDWLAGCFFCFPRRLYVEYGRCVVIDRFVDVRSRKGGRVVCLPYYSIPGGCQFS